MPDIFDIELKIKAIIDELKALCVQAGLANQAGEENIITSIFLYKFLNDKFMYHLGKFAKEIEMTMEEVIKNENDEMDAFYDAYSGDVALGYDDTIQSLINQVGADDFYHQFDAALARIASDPRNEKFAFETPDGSHTPLFTSVFDKLNLDAASKNNFAKNAMTALALEKFDFTSAFESSFDFYAAIFEYLIKDYNVAAGKYAEYFTPQ